MKLTKLLCKALPLALCAALLATSAGAVPPLISPAPENVKTQIESIPSAVRVWGTLTKLDNGDLRLQNSGEMDGVINDIVLHLSEDTLILNAVDGTPITPDDLKEGEIVYAYASPAMTKSLPPQSTAVLILGGVPADFGAPSYYEVTDFNMISTMMTEHNIINASISTDQGVTLQFSLTDELDEAGNRSYILKDDVTFAAYQSDAEVQVTDLIPGARILVWLGAEGVLSKVMVFPYTYAGCLDVTEDGAISLNHQMLDSFAVTAGDGTQLLPLRAVCEALGLTVLWDNASRTVTVSRTEPEGMERALFSYTLGGDSAQAGDEHIPLHSPGQTHEGRTFLTVSDLVRLLDLYLVR